MKSTFLFYIESKQLIQQSYIISVCLTDDKSIERIEVKRGKEAPTDTASDSEPAHRGHRLRSVSSNCFTDCSTVRFLRDINKVEEQWG